jgi:hypothetical protein
VGGAPDRMKAITSMYLILIQVLKPKFVSKNHIFLSNLLYF